METHTSTAVASHISLEKWQGTSHITFHSSHNILSNAISLPYLGSDTFPLLPSLPFFTLTTTRLFPCPCTHWQDAFQTEKGTPRSRGGTSATATRTHRKHPRGHGNNAGGMQHHRMNFDKHHWLFQKSRHDTLSLEKKPRILCYCHFGDCGYLEANRKGSITWKMRPDWPQSLILCTQATTKC